MARVFIDGFETGTLDLWNYVVGSGTVSTSAPESGVYRANLAGGGIGKSIAASSIIYTALSMKTTLLTYPGIIIGFTNSTTPIGMVYFSTVSKTLQYSVGTTIVSTGSQVLSSAIYYRIETFLQVSSNVGAGRCIVKINGTTDIDFTGITQPAALTQFDRIYINRSTTDGNQPFQNYDNIVFDDATWVGNTKIIALSPSASGASTGWTPSAGENYACMDDVPITTADCVSVNTASALDLYNIPSVISSATSIHSIQVSIVHEVEGSPTPTKTQIAIQHNSTQAFSSSLTPGAAGSPAYGTKLWDTNPVSGSSWTVSDINSLQIGIKSATA